VTSVELKADVTGAISMSASLIGVAIFAMSAAWLGAKVTIAADMIRLFLLGLPVLLAGTWLGLKLYGRVNEATFRKVVLVVLLLSGAALVV
jgi:uncharacterized membrane protein YfcA